MKNKFSKRFNALITRIRNHFRVTTFLRTVYFKLAPYGSRRYKLSRKVLRRFLNNFRLLNIRYQYWIEHFDKLNQDDIQHYSEKLAKISPKPLLSVIMPVFNPNINYLEEAIKSVQDQLYPQWELCIADDASTKPGVTELIREYAKTDQRIKAVFREQNGHISAASNSALELASGDFIVLLDHDDKLHPLALYFLAQEINSHPESKVIYSDEDKLTHRGKRIDPYFKSDFDYELLLCQNMVSHLGAYQTEIVRKIGGFRIGLEGSQDYDLLLRVIERIDIHHIRHIPRVLYHWRISKQSVSSTVDVKPYAVEAGIQALQDHLSNQEFGAEVNGFGKYGYEINYALPKPEPEVACFINLMQVSDDSINPIESIFNRTQYKNLKLYIGVDKSNLNQRTLEKLININPSQINIINHREPAVYLNDIAQIIEQTNAEFLGLIDASCVNFSDHWLEKLISLASSPDIGTVSPRLVYENKAIHSSGVILGVDGLANHIFHRVLMAGPDFYFGWSHLNKGYSALPWGCVFVNREKFRMVQGLDEELQNDNSRLIDFCLKLKQLDFRNILTPDVNIVVSQTQTSSTIKPNGQLVMPEKDEAIIRKRWQKWISKDPAYHPNLTIHHGKPMIAKSTDSIKSGQTRDSAG